MNLKSYSKKISPPIKVLLSLGNLFSVIIATIIVFAADYFSSLSLHWGIIILIAVIAVTASAFVMPLVYALINGTTAISTGRYHIPLVISGLVAALCNALLFNLYSLTAVVAGVCLFIIIFFISLALQTYYYVYFSISTRMFEKPALPILNFFITIIGFIGALCLYTFMPSSLIGITNSAYIVSIAASAITILVYLSTYSSMPFFIRIEPASNYTIRENYRRFINPLYFSVSRKLIVSRLMYVTAVAIAFMSLFLGARQINLNSFFTSAACFAAIVIMAIGYALCSKAFKRNINNVFKSAICFSIFFGIGLLLTLLPMLFKLNTVFTTACFIGGAALFGLGASSLLAVGTIRIKISKVSSNSRGSAYSLLNAFSAVGIAIAISIVLGAYLIMFYLNDIKYLPYAYLAVIAVAFSLKIASSVLTYAALKQKKPQQIILNKPEIPLPEPLQAETDQDGQLTMETVDTLLTSKEYEDV